MKVFILALVCALSVFTYTVVAESLTSCLTTRLQKKDEENEQKATIAQTVQFSKLFRAGYLIGTIVINLALVAFVVLMFHFNIIESEQTIIILAVVIGAASVFFNVTTVLFSVKAEYDDEKIIVKRAFRKTKEFYYKDILHYTSSGNLKVQTSQGNFLLFYACEGINALRAVISEKTKKQI